MNEKKKCNTSKKQVQTYFYFFDKCSRVAFFSIDFWVTAMGGRPKPEICFFPEQLRRMLLPKERYGECLWI